MSSLRHFPRRQSRNGGKWSKNGKRIPRAPIHMFLTSAVCFSRVLHGYVSTILPESKLSEARLRLTEGEVAEVQRGQQAPHKVSASVFVRMGLELEEQQ